MRGKVDLVSHLSSLSDTGNNQDDVETINLPFTFRFYGVEYDQISISSNGWIAMGETELESFRNYELPGVGGPSKMIAVFWDDLKTSNGEGYIPGMIKIKKKVLCRMVWGSNLCRIIL